MIKVQLKKIINLKFKITIKVQFKKIFKKNILIILKRRLKNEIKFIFNI